VRTSKEALELLAPAAASGEMQLPFDMILKEHEPQLGANACRLLRKLARTDLLTRIPVVCECWLGMSVLLEAMHHESVIISA
jgi:hypothetical protein